MRLGRGFLFSCLATFCFLILGFLPMPSALRMALSVTFTLLSVIVPWGFRLAPIALKKQSFRRVFKLESIRASHFVERVRWCLDLSGASYVEVRAIAHRRVHLGCSRVQWRSRTSRLPLCRKQMLQFWGCS